MKFYGDYHTHTRRSDGRQSEEQIIVAALGRGLKEVAITDHGPLAAVIGVKNPEVYLQTKERVKNLQPLYPDLTILVGAEANIRDLDGNLDVPSAILDQLDIVIAGLHPYTLPTSFQDGVGIFVQNSLRHLSQAQREKADPRQAVGAHARLVHHPERDERRKQRQGRHPALAPPGRTADIRQAGDPFGDARVDAGHDQRAEFPHQLFTPPR